MSTQPNQIGQSPSAIINILEANIPRYFDNQIYHIRGRYLQTGRKQYSVYYYDTLADETTDAKITILMPTTLRIGLEDQSIYTLTGTFVRRVRKDPATVEFQLEVSASSGRQAPRISTEQLKRIEILKHKHDTGFKDPTGPFKALLLEHKKINIALIYGETAVVHTDLENALGAAGAGYNFTSYTTTITNQKRLAEAIRKADQSPDYDAIAIIRGGGSNFQVYDDIPLAEQACQCQTPLITALGHAQDTPFLQQIADKSFDTPTALGNWLRKLFEEIAYERTQSYNLALRDIEAQHQKQLQESKTLLQQTQQLADQKEQIQLNTIAQHQKEIQRLQNQPGRPTWIVSALISLVTLILGMMIMYIFQYL